MEVEHHPSLSEHLPVEVQEAAPSHQAPADGEGETEMTEEPYTTDAATVPEPRRSGSATRTPVRFRDGAQ